MTTSVKVNLDLYLNPIYEIKKKLLKLKIKEGQKIKVGFFVIFDSVFPALPLFEKMIEDEIFEPYIVIIPDVSRGYDNMLFQLEKSYNTFSQRYKNNVYMCYDKETNALTDFKNKFDIVCFANIYDSMTHPVYSINYYKDAGILSFFINYAYCGRTKYEQSMFRLNEYKYLWKIFCENEKTKSEILKAHFDDIDQSKLVLTGYCKMDNMAKQKKVKRKRKKIIIAPHHTVRVGQGLELSNFLAYSEFFLKLPKLYPEIDFVFRPHPLLFVTLKNNDLWGNEKTEKYLEEMLLNPNLEYSEGGEYFNLFINSDGLIHDCGSFLAEYLYTENPQCYILKDDKAINNEFLDFGIEMLDHTYKAFSENDIINFIDNVVLKKQDTMKESRLKFAEKFIKINHPNVSETILKYIKEQLTT